MDVRFLCVISFRIADLNITSQHEQPKDFISIPAEVRETPTEMTFPLLLITYMSAFTRISFSVSLLKFSPTTDKA